MLIPAREITTKQELQQHIDELVGLLKTFPEAYVPRNDYDNNEEHMQHKFLQSYDNFLEAWKNNVFFWNVTCGEKVMAITEDRSVLFFSIPESNERFVDLIKSDWNKHYKQNYKGKGLQEFIKDFITEVMWEYAT